MMLPDGMMAGNGSIGEILYGDMPRLHITSSPDSEVVEFDVAERILLADTAHLFYLCGSVGRHRPRLLELSDDLQVYTEQGHKLSPEQFSEALLVFSAAADQLAKGLDTEAARAAGYITSSGAFAQIDRSYSGLNEIIARLGSLCEQS